MKWLWAYADGNTDPSIWDNQTRTGLIHAEVKDAHQAKTLLDLTDQERKSLQDNGEVFIDRDGLTYQVTLR